MLYLLIFSSRATKLSWSSSMAFKIPSDFSPEMKNSSFFSKYESYRSGSILITVINQANASRSIYTFNCRIFRRRRPPSWIWLVITWALTQASRRAERVSSWTSWISVLTSSFVLLEVAAIINKCRKRKLWEIDGLIRCQCFEIFLQCEQWRNSR